MYQLLCSSLYFECYAGTRLYLLFFILHVLLIKGIVLIKTKVCVLIQLFKICPHYYVVR